MKPNSHIRGFTLVELMIVVAILSVLAAVAIVAYQKWVRSARETEAQSILADVRVKQEAYRATFRQYAGDEVWAPAQSAPGESAVDWDSTATADAKTTWRQLGLSPTNKSLYFRYYFDSGAPGTDPSDVFGSLDIGQSTDYWFGARAVHDLDGDGTCAGFDIYAASDRLHSFDEHVDNCP